MRGTGRSHLIDLCPTVVMGDSVLDRIVDCTHFEKIKIVEDLRKETHWPVNDDLAREVISLIHHIIPISLYTTAPLQQRPLSTTALNNGSAQHPVLAPPNGMRKVSKCSACGQPGHHKRGRVCPMHPSRTSSAAGKENEVKSERLARMVNSDNQVQSTSNPNSQRLAGMVNSDNQAQSTSNSNSQRLAGTVNSDNQVQSVGQP
ncbi:hypothetical protein DFJ58DRAFT_733343 [Suillus subalutaceus]|uniref:uncharacterized protein n=1 Tax=Suillus subalutaceus TaxID=48586 RepID=UPI001B877142|nr:uncharacterized protein DFJ58DRAFT_733343 [Suillus subalutaceus]KAG1839400.1 hypothetical protein DFJ58DRAFT_733343 [Suillus subalutaceus]